MVFIPIFNKSENESFIYIYIYITEKYVQFLSLLTHLCDMYLYIYWWIAFSDRLRNSELYVTVTLIN
jgi:hypothetical protein